MCDLAWQKSSFCADGGNNCVEVAAAPDGSLRLRESDEPGAVLTVDRAAFGRLVAVLEAGDVRLDSPA